MSYIYKKVSTRELIHELHHDGDGLWGYDASVIIAEYLEKCAEKTGVPIEIDIEAWERSIEEFSSIDEYNKEYETEYECWEDLDQWHIIDRLPNGGAVCEH